MRRPLRSIPEARLLSGLELDNSASGVAAGKRKRRTKGKKPEVRNGRGLAKPREPSKPADRPKLMVVGDAEFTSEPQDTKVVATIRLLTLANLPGPFRSYNTLPSGARFDTLKQFLQRYSWGEEEDVLRCIDVFENIAAEAYSRVLTDTRRVCLEKYGPSKEEWKGYCPRWCKNEEIWKGLCDIWSTPIWEQQSSRNRANKLKCGSVASHVGGSRSTFRHKQKMIAERGEFGGVEGCFRSNPPEEGKGWQQGIRQHEITPRYGPYRPKSREHILISPYLLNTWCDLLPLVGTAVPSLPRNSSNFVISLSF
ncbi:Plant transposase (Ptta/En/Spm family) [Carex littledalei]|uniref:Plant transposase (Ptta/En/Spm family) n=1 Tax=Carex littledalei TaxID=544730 RepID=A0A833RIR9_9POAL|nr:Plant transposase (Ptta/En/Spm family) [Carex littledalei]